MIYQIKHTTAFAYSAPIRESVMELRVRPRSDGGQRCLEFSLETTPEARPHSYVDYLGNTVHHFDVPSTHHQLRIEAASLVQVASAPQAPRALPKDAWSEVDRLGQSFDNWDWLSSSAYAQPTDRLRALAEELKATRRDDPLSLLKELNSGLHRALVYEPSSTRVDSPIDECLEKRRGVCQDFAHVFVALARLLRIPSRYVSGHLFHRPGAHGGEDASHAWAEVLLPEVGWMGFDPSNDVLVADEHVRVAVGRDYADVPPTRGVYKGVAESQLTVKVAVTQA
jgi:transglutaminase-like putative cysteine protease